MTTVPVLWCSRHDDILARGYADQGLFEAILDRSVWRPQDPIVFEHLEVRGDFPDVDGALVVINCRTHASPEDVEWFTAQLDRLAWSVVILCGDEEWVFPWRKVTRTDRRRVWIMQARPEHAECDGFLPGGWYPNTPDHLKAAGDPDREHDWFFGGQITHERRQQCAAVLRDLPGGALVETTRYLEEVVPRPEYFRLMASAKVIPCPSGPYSVDCARAFEALEAGCVPVCDTVTAYAGEFDYWQLIFRTDPPFPRIQDWNTFPDILERTLAEGPATANRVFAFWQQHKRSLARQLDDDLRAAAGIEREHTSPDDTVTVIVTTSPAPLHPSTEHLERTIASIREQLPAAEIVIVADGVRPEQDARRADYELYVSRMLWLCNFEWTNVVPIVLDTWQHQANAARAALELVHTPQILFVEHDTPLVGPIDWRGLVQFVASGEANVVRLHQDVDIHPDHERIFLDHETVWRGATYEVPVRRTTAWWQRPHLASTRFYREQVMPLIGRRARTMIEEVIYAVVAVACQVHGEAGWWDWRLWVYTPEPDMRRSGHLDSRGEEPKFEMLYRYDGPTPVGAPPPGRR